MRKLSLALIIIITLSIVIGCQFTQVIMASKNEFFLAYPPDRHETTAQSIFFVGVASRSDQVYINNQSIERSKSGYFAATFPLEIGENQFKVTHQGEEKLVTVIKNNSIAEIPQDTSFGKASLTPQQNIERLTGESICFSAIAAEGARVMAKLDQQVIPLASQTYLKQLAANNAVLIDSSQPQVESFAGHYKGCSSFSEKEVNAEAIYELTLNGLKNSQKSPGKVKISSPKHLGVVVITAFSGITRTGPSTDYSRLTPLPKGTFATVTGKEGEWLRLDYGAWIQAKETSPIQGATPVNSLIRGIYSRKKAGSTEILFPLEVPVPFTVQQGERTFTLTLYNTTAQTDLIRLDYDPFLRRMDWQQISPNQIEYIFRLTGIQQWGYSLRYEGTTLILSLRDPIEPEQSNGLKGIKILLDPGHGGEDSGAIGPTGYPEKEATLIVAKFLQEELTQLGANVQMTRTSDVDVSLEERVNLIEQVRPAFSLSLHYNSLPDGGDPVTTKGVSSYWYHPQAHDLAAFLENYITRQLKRTSYGVYWDNLALTRPTIAPSILLELAFIINPEEFEWITNLDQQRKLARTIAHGIQEWFDQD